MLKTEDTKFTLDVRGEPWSPCAACPHATPGACPSRFHRPYCDLMAKNPKVWSDKIAAMPACTDEPAETNHKGTEAPEGPSLARKVINVAKAAARIAVSTVKDVPDDAYKIRTDTCRSCEKLNKENLSCSVCGCPIFDNPDRNLPVIGHRGKARIATERCPIGRWPIYQPPAPESPSEAPVASGATVVRSGGCGCS